MINEKQRIFFKQKLFLVLYVCQSLVLFRFSFSVEIGFRIIFFFNFQRVIDLERHSFILGKLRKGSFLMVFRF